ncbi:YbaB/EbfC family nucleoid-associated protein [Streptomyces sp. NPDC013178]|uniref:YbaB/EbfC family nucleoid-associated protein n=1 Tax=Streptomyces sp. NPDC013178 TaxID=3155118 RepID=UPI003408AD6E
MDPLDPSGIEHLLDGTQRMQQHLARAQEELRQLTASGTDPQGAVQVTVDSRGAITRLDISPAVADPDNTEVLAELILVAVSAAYRSLIDRQREQFDPLLRMLASMGRRPV